MVARLTIATRLVLGFGALLAFLVGAVVLGLDRLASVDQIIGRIVSLDWQKTVLANKAIDLINTQTRDTFLLFHLPDREHSAVRTRISERADTITDLLERLDELIYAPEGKALLAEIRGLRRTYVDSFQNVSRLLGAGEREQASQKMETETAQALEALISSIDRLISLQGRLLEQSGEEVAASYASARSQLIVFLGFALMSSVILSVWIIRAVTRPLGGEPDEAKAAVERIAQGDLATEIDVKPGDDHSLLAALQGMQHSLRKMVENLTGNANGVAAAAEQLGVVSKQIAASSALQSDAASSMASAAEQMTVSIGQVSDSAADARQITTDAGERSASGSAVIDRTVAEMQVIADTVAAAAKTIQIVGDSSQDISAIVQVIKDVADQTNLLALNAAIEAARAGEQGRGFAVVADEVRKLAERTAQATMDIGSMIESMQSRAGEAVRTMEQAVTYVEGGVQLASQAGESMGQISSGARRTVTAVNEISDALQEQSVASSEIAGNVEKIAQMSAENRTATQQAHATVEQLQALAASTLGAVRVFRI